MSKIQTESGEKKKSLKNKNFVDFVEKKKCYFHTQERDNLNIFKHQQHSKN